MPLRNGEVAVSEALRHDGQSTGSLKKGSSPSWRRRATRNLEGRRWLRFIDATDTVKNLRCRT